MSKFALNAWRREYAQIVIEADSLEDAEEAAWEYSQGDFDWDSEGFDVEVEELDE